MLLYEKYLGPWLAHNKCHLSSSPSSLSLAAVALFKAGPFTNENFRLEFIVPMVTPLVRSLVSGWIDSSMAL